jgi:2'-5' RNA ligase
VRLFVAIVPPAEALALVEDRVAALRPQWPGLRWTSRESWHITLAFLGEVAEKVGPELGIRLERAARRHHAQDVAVQGGGAFPAPKRARILWAGVQADQAALRALAGSVAAGARRAGAPPPDEGRRYHPHLTLAYLRQAADVSELTGALADLAGPPWTAGHIQLVRSHPPTPGKPGARPRYEPLTSYPLRPQPGAPH